MSTTAATVKRDFDLQTESAHCKTRLQTFTADLMEMLHVSSPDMMALMRADRSRRDKNVYFYLPFCFAQSFDVDIDILRQLSYAGILWMSYSRFQDDVIDRSSSPTATQILFKDMYLIESLRQMYGVLPATSAYWRYFARYHAQFVTAVAQEKYKEAEPAQSYSDDDFRLIATGKAAMAKCAVASLGVLTRAESRIRPLEDAIDKYHMAYQRYDDVVDWKADLASGARTQLLDLVKSHLRPEERSLPAEQMATRLAQILHYRGLADRHLAEAQKLCEQSTELAAAEGCRIWVGNVQRLHTLIAGLQADLRIVAQRNILNAGPAGELASHPVIKWRDPVNDRNSTRASLARAHDYIAALQRRDGTWSDFLHGGTSSIEWTTAYVGMQLKDSDFPRPSLDAAAAALCQRQVGEGGWGWSLDITPVDADSTSCALAFLNECEAFQDDARERALSRMQRFFDPSKGGYATYNDGPALRGFLGRNHPTTASVRGWCSAQVCVTAVAVESQLAYAAVDPAQIERSIAFLRATQTEEGFWHSYWWDGVLYSTFHALRVLHDFADANDGAPIARAQDWIVSSQAPDGSWGEQLPGRNRAFNTALAIDALLITPRAEHRDAIERGIRWLLRHQYADGSWPGGRILRIPRPHSLTPWTRADWKESPTELNVLLRDNNGLFTSSTVAHALSSALATL